MVQFKESLGQKLGALQLPQGTKVKAWVIDEARFGLHTGLRRVSLEVTEGQAHFAHLPTVNLDCDALYLEELAASDADAVHVVIHDNAGLLHRAHPSGSLRLAVSAALRLS